MTRDVVLSRELESLQDEIFASEKERDIASARASAGPKPKSKPTVPKAEETELRDQLRELTDEVTKFVAEAEKSMSEHPLQSVVGALLIGILIGRLLGRH